MIGRWSTRKVRRNLAVNYKFRNNAPFFCAIDVSIVTEVNLKKGNIVNVIAKAVCGIFSLILLLVPNFGFANEIQIYTEAELQKQKLKCATDRGACNDLGNYFGRGDKKHNNRREAARYFIKACEMGLLDGCFGVNFIGNYLKEYKDGTDTVQAIYRKAMDKLANSCEAGVQNDCVDLGTMYSVGWGARKSDEIALKYWEKACEKDFGLACFEVSQALGNKSFEAKDKELEKKAASFLIKSCNLRYYLGCAKLGDFYLRGYGVDQSYLKAAEMYKMTCENGNGYSCKDLGELYEKGRGVELSRVKAKQFYDKACALRPSDLCK